MLILARYMQNAKGNELDGLSRKILSSEFARMKEQGGNWVIDIKRHGYYTGRYKYYFGYALTVALSEIGHKVQIWDESINDMRPIGTVEELHEIVKHNCESAWYQVQLPGQALQRMPRSTTAMNDVEFYNIFEPEALEFLFNLGAFQTDFLSREEYAAQQKAKKEQPHE